MTSNESYWAVPSCGAVYYAVEGRSNLRILLYKVVLAFESEDKIIECDFKWKL